MSRHGSHDTTMHTDDRVAPGATRSKALVLVAVGFLVAVMATAGLLQGLQSRANSAARQATLSRNEVQQLRNLLADRKVARDQERDVVQDQLDEQAKVLCLAIAEFRAGARSIQGKAILDRAARDLHCSTINQAAPSTSSGPTSSSSAAPAPDAGAAPGHTSSSRPTSPQRPPSAQPSPPTTPAPLRTLLTPLCGLIPPLPLC